jgi:phage/conjugal plasmid C-4 type zinc finger TraR family protein
MASGWAPEGAVQDQIDASIEDAVAAVRRNISGGESAEFCEECDAPIPEARRKALPGVRYCIKCQSALETKEVKSSLYNRRGSKDSQLR